MRIFTFLISILYFVNATAGYINYIPKENNIKNDVSFIYNENNNFKYLVTKKQDMEIIYSSNYPKNKFWDTIEFKYNKYSIKKSNFTKLGYLSLQYSEFTDKGQYIYDFILQPNSAYKLTKVTFDPRKKFNYCEEDIAKNLTDQLKNIKNDITKNVKCENSEAVLAEIIDTTKSGMPKFLACLGGYNAELAAKYDSIFNNPSLICDNTQKSNVTIKEGETLISINISEIKNAQEGRPVYIHELLHAAGLKDEDKVKDVLDCCDSNNSTSDLKIKCAKLKQETLISSIKSNLDKMEFSCKSNNNNDSLVTIKNTNYRLSRLSEPELAKYSDYLNQVDSDLNNKIKEKTNYCIDKKFIDSFACEKNKFNKTVDCINLFKIQESDLDDVNTDTPSESVPDPGKSDYESSTMPLVIGGSNAAAKPNLDPGNKSSLAPVDSPSAPAPTSATTSAPTSVPSSTKSYSPPSYATTPTIDYKNPERTATELSKYFPKQDDIKTQMNNLSVDLNTNVREKLRGVLVASNGNPVSTTDVPQVFLQDKGNSKGVAAQMTDFAAYFAKNDKANPKPGSGKSPGSIEGSSAREVASTSGGGSRSPSSASGGVGGGSNFRGNKNVESAGLSEDLVKLVKMKDPNTVKSYFDQNEQSLDPDLSRAGVQVYVDGRPYGFKSGKAKRTLYFNSDGGWSEK